MTKHLLFTLIYLFLFSFQLFGQKPVAVERVSRLELDLKRSSSRTFSIDLSSEDILSLSAKAEGTVNLKLTDPNGNVIYQGIIKSKKLEWQKTVTDSGIFILEVQSAAVLLNTKIALQITVVKPNFTYGYPLMDSFAVLASNRSKKVMVDGEFEIMRNIPKTYTYSVEKGDTLIFSLNPITKNTPRVEIQNELGEMLFAAFSTSKQKYVEIPILKSGSYGVTLISDAFLPKKNYIKVEKISPKRYTQKVVEAIEEEAAAEKPKALYDTIPEIYLDSIYFLGAQRDIINPSELNLKFKFEQPESIIKWLIFYGSGKEFLQEVDQYAALLQGEPMAAGATNILTAYGLGFMKKLPSIESGQLSFTPSAAIQNQLKPPLQNNYASIKGGKGDHALKIANKSRSAGQQVLVQVVVIRRVRLQE